MQLKNITLEITNKCLQKCIHCSSSSCDSDNNIFELEKIDNILFEASNMGTNEISISGGEPFLHPNLIHILQKTKQYNMITNIYTCGIVGDINNFKSIDLCFLEKIKPYINKIIFSLHGTKESSNNITTIDGYDLIIQSLKNAIDLNMNVETHFVPLTKNIDCFEELVDIVYKMGVRKISVLRAVPQGRCNHYLIMNRDDTLTFLQNTINIENKYGDLSIRRGHPWKVCLMPCEEGRCSAGINKAVIMSNGDVVPCEAFKFYKGKNIHDDSLLNIFNNEDLFLKLKIMYIINQEREWANLIKNI